MYQAEVQEAGAAQCETADSACRIIACRPASCKGEASLPHGSALTTLVRPTYDCGFPASAPPASACVPPMEKTKVAIVGLGTVGSGVAKLLLDYGDRTARHAGRTLWLEQVVGARHDQAARLRPAARESCRPI